MNRFEEDKNDLHKRDTKGIKKISAKEKKELKKKEID